MRIFLYSLGILVVSALIVAGCGKTEQAGEGARSAGTQELVAEPDPPETQEVDEQPAPVKQVNPSYPGEARDQNIEGTVFVKVLVDRDGTVRRAEIAKSDNSLFDQASLDAIKQWEFRPAMKNGEAVAAWVTVPVRFKLE